MGGSWTNSYQSHFGGKLQDASSEWKQRRARASAGHDAVCALDKQAGNGIGRPNQCFVRFHGFVICSQIRVIVLLFAV